MLAFARGRAVLGEDDGPTSVTASVRLPDAGSAANDCATTQPARGPGLPSTLPASTPPASAKVAAQLSAAHDRPIWAAGLRLSCTVCAVAAGGLLPVGVFFLLP